MKPFAVLLAAVLAATVFFPTIASAQAPSSTAPVTGMKPDRTTAPAATRKAMMAREAEKRKKRAACRAEARAKKIGLLKRPAYVRECAAR